MSPLALLHTLSIERTARGEIGPLHINYNSHAHRRQLSSGILYTTLHKPSVCQATCGSTYIQAPCLANRQDLRFDEDILCKQGHKKTLKNTGIILNAQKKHWYCTKTLVLWLDYYASKDTNPFAAGWYAVVQMRAVPRSPMISFHKADSN